MRLKKQIVIETILIITIMLMQMILPTIYSIAAEEELVTIQFEDANFYNAMTNSKSLEGKISTKDDVNLTISMSQENIDSVTAIRMSDLDIKSVSGIEYFKNLQTLDLSTNEIDDISMLASLTNLEYLTLYSNKITNINALSNLKKLRILNLNSNEISEISVLSNLTNLETLYLSNNKINNVNELAELVNLKDLDLDSNEIDSISMLSNLRNLEDLSLSNNKIEDINALSNLTNLKFLLLSGNQISNINSLSNLIGLEFLSLGYNKISNINSLSNLIKLEYLTIEGSEIRDISALSNLTNLETLYLGHNKISDISSLANLTNLRYLRLGNNEISNINSLSGLTKLEELHLDFNKVNNVSSISNLTNLNLLLSHNKIFINGKSGDIVELPQIFIEAQNESSIIYSESGLTLRNCKWSDDRNSVIVESTPASVIINLGSAYSTVLEIDENQSDNPNEDKTPEEKTEFKLGRDNNSFLHTNLEKYNKAGFIGVNNYKIPSKYYEMITKNVTEGEKEKIISREYEEWDGSCYGIAAMMGLAYYDKIDLTLIQDGIAEFYNLEEPYKNDDLLNLIQTYYLSQYLEITEENNKEYMKPLLFGLLVSGDNDYKNLENFLEDFVNTVKNEIVQFSYSYEQGGHSILACGCKELEDGSYIIKLYDMNSTNLQDTQGSFEYMTISSDFKEFDIDNRINNKNYKVLNFMKLNAYDELNIEKASENALENKNNITIGFKANSKFEIANSKNETLTYNGEDLSGNIEVLDVDLIAKGENEAELEITIPYDEKLTYKENNEKTELYVHDNTYYMSISGENIDKVTLDLDNSMKVEGENCKIQAQIDNTSGGLYEIRADVENEVQLIRDGDNIKIISEQELKNVDINELTKEEKKDLQDGISGKNIVIDGEGKITSDKKEPTNNELKDDTIAKDNLPNTGRIILITIGVILSIIIVTSHIVYRKYKNIF